jgi:uncharacterized membrane protein
MPATRTGASYSAKGTEPFWSAEVTGADVTLTRPTDTGTVVKTFATTQSDK